MSSNANLVATVLSETLACQDPASTASQGRRNGRYAPLGPHIPNGSGGYPTTDTAMDALAELADRYRENNPALKVVFARDPMRLLVSQIFGEVLPEIAQEQDSTKHWPMIRKQLTSRVPVFLQDINHYVPVWLFLNQECMPFSIGPVQFVGRKDWLDVIKARHGTESSWMPGVRTLWAGGQLRGGSLWVGLKAGTRAFLKRPTQVAIWQQAFSEARRQSEPTAFSDARKVARMIHPDQWVAHVEVKGFEREESRRRGLLAIRVALDTVRSVLDGTDRRLISTIADSVVPLSVDRLSQVAGKDLSHGWRFNRPGISGPPGCAQTTINHYKVVFDAAGECIAAATQSQLNHSCPALADRWFNATHWFGRACLADVDFVAVVMLVIALDVLCGGLQDRGILELIARLTGTPMSKSVLPDGTTLKELVEHSYKLRSEVAHGSILAVHKMLDIERVHLESLAAAAIREYAIQLQSYAQVGGADDRDAFRNSLPPAQP